MKTRVPGSTVVSPSSVDSRQVRTRNCAGASMRSASSIATSTSDGIGTERGVQRRGRGRDGRAGCRWCSGRVAAGADHEHDLRTDGSRLEPLAVDLGDEEPGERVLGPLLLRQREAFLDPRVDVVAQLGIDVGQARCSRPAPRPPGTGPPPSAHSPNCTESASGKPSRRAIAAGGIGVARCWTTSTPVGPADSRPPASRRGAAR